MSEQIIKSRLETLTCGIIRPISTTSDCDENHWIEIEEIIKNSVNLIDEYNFTCSLVSRNDDVGVIHKEIVNNLYTNEIVVCDVSCKNPNVMFELGMRLAFDKPTIVIKDNSTGYSFDTSPIAHLEYPRDLRFQKIIKFQNDLAEKIKNTYKKSLDQDNKNTFLSSFGPLERVELSEEKIVVTKENKEMMDLLKNLQSDIKILKRGAENKSHNKSSFLKNQTSLLPLNHYINNAIDIFCKTRGKKKNELYGNLEFYNYVNEIVPINKCNDFDDLKESVDFLLLQK